jgi:hypothetical protein
MCSSLGARAVRPPGESGKRKAEGGKRALLLLSSFRLQLSAFYFPLSACFAQRAGRPRSQFLVILLSCVMPFSLAWAQDPFADAVVSFTPGTHAGFGADQLPGIVLGPPRGSGLSQGSFDVVSLGNDGVIVIGFDLPLICDGPGADFTVFENAFHAGSPSGPVFTDYGVVAVSQDGEHFVDLPYDATTHAGLAGQTPVLSHPDNMIDPLDPSVAGGDLFDLAATGLAWAAYLRITDPGAAIPDAGNQIPQADNSGFDLDAIAALHACDPSSLPSATPTATPTLEGGDPTASATPTPTAEMASPTATTAAIVPGDLNGDGRVTAADAAWLIGEIYDGDGEDAAGVGGGGVASGPAADANGDGRITGADLAALARRSD